MNDRYLFGKDFNRQFIALEDNVPFQIPSQTPTIYIFDAMPTRTEAIAGTGAVATISSWNQDGVSPFPNRYTVSAIADPSPSDNVNEYWYYEAINYVTKSAGQSQCLIRPFQLCRAFAPSSLPNVSSVDLKEVYPAISEYLTDDELSTFIGNAQEEMINDLANKGLEWGKLGDLRKARLALAYRAIAEASLSQVKSADDRFDYRYKIFLDKYNHALNSLNLPYDSDGDGVPESIEKPVRSYWVIDN